MRSVEHHPVSSRTELVRSSISIREETLHSRNIHMIISRFLHSGIRREKILRRSSSGEELSGHLYVCGRSKVPVIGGFGPSSIVVGTVGAVEGGVRDRETEDRCSDTGGVVTSDRESSSSQSVVADLRAILVSTISQRRAAKTLRSSSFRSQQSRSCCLCRREFRS